MQPGLGRESAERAGALHGGGSEVWDWGRTAAEVGVGPAAAGTVVVPGSAHPPHPTHPPACVEGEPHAAVVGIEGPARHVDVQRLKRLELGGAGEGHAHLQGSTVVKGVQAVDTADKKHADEKGEYYSLPFHLTWHVRGPNERQDEAME